MSVNENETEWDWDWEGMEAEPRLRAATPWWRRICFADDHGVLLIIYFTFYFTHARTNWQQYNTHALLAHGLKWKISQMTSQFASLIPTVLCFKSS